GDSAADLWQALLNAQPLWRPSTTLPANALSTELTGFDLARFRQVPNGNRRPRTSQYALAAAAQAVGQAGLDSKNGVNKDDVAIVYGTGTGPISLTELALTAMTNSGLGAAEPLWFQESVFNAPASFIGIEYGFHGPLVALPMGWAAGGHAIAVAADLITFGSAPIALVVVSDELAPLAYNAYRALGLVSPNDGAAQSMRPFDVRRNGAVLGEGAAAIVIETHAHAMQRGARPLMRLTGWSITSDSFGVGSKGAGPTSLHHSMSAALKQARRDRIDVVYSGSYCVTDADQVEAAAIRTVFGANSSPPVTNIRGSLGEVRGTTGLLNLVAAAESLQTGIIPPTAGCEQIDPLCDIDVVTTQRSGTIEAVLCNSFWVNGVNASVVLEAQ
ncbi:MAG: hypothetical protein H7Y02_04075, partial [Candidatus Obscuribacterales bacterium]|nr:hypothetical protein [Steroidobacteraceae bacterium]